MWPLMACTKCPAVAAYGEQRLDLFEFQSLFDRGFALIEAWRNRPSIPRR
jgi:hypothetical protein